MAPGTLSDAPEPTCLRSVLRFSIGMPRFRGQGSGFRVRGPAFRVQGWGFWPASAAPGKMAGTRAVVTTDSERRTFSGGCDWFSGYLSVLFPLFFTFSVLPFQCLWHNPKDAEKDRDRLPL